MIELLEGPIQPATVANAMKALELHSNNGANAWFMGRVRADRIDGREVQGIEYSAYPAMVISSGEALIAEARNKFDLLGLAIWHSTGLVKVGEVSLLVLASSAHRKAAFHALEWTVDELKVRLPVWKKEVFTDGSHRWIGTPGSG